MGPTHRALSIPELLYQIFSSLAKSDLVSLAISSKSVHDIAIVLLWRHMSAIQPLVSLLPRRSQSDTGVQNPQTSAPGLSDYTDWGRFDHYAAFVKSMRLTYWNAPNWRNAEAKRLLLLRLAQRRCPGGLLPKLAILVIEAREAADLWPLHVLTGPSLRHFKLCGRYEAGPTPFQSLEAGDAAPLELSVLNLRLTRLPAILPSVLLAGCRVQSLQRLFLNLCDHQVDDSLLIQMTEARNLRKLSFHITPPPQDKWQWPGLHCSIWPELVSLDSNPTILISFLRVVSISEGLSAIGIQATESERANVQAVLDEIGRACTSIQAIRIDVGMPRGSSPSHSPTRKLSLDSIFKQQQIKSFDIRDSPGVFDAPTNVDISNVASRWAGLQALVWSTPRRPCATESALALLSHQCRALELLDLPFRISTPRTANSKESQTRLDGLRRLVVSHWVLESQNHGPTLQGVRLFKLLDKILPSLSVVRSRRAMVSGQPQGVMLRDLWEEVLLCLG